MKYRFFIIIGVILFGFNELFVSDAFAYIDSGSGSLVIQIIVGALVGAGITIKIYWYKLKEKLIRTNKKND
jgi:hypothetical protein